MHLVPLYRWEIDELFRIFRGWAYNESNAVDPEL
jgi:hypothetical protein